MSLPSYDDVVTARYVDFSFIYHLKELPDPPHWILLTNSSTGPKLPHILRLVAARLDSTSLSSCCRISKACNDVLNPLLWSNPMKVLAEKKKPFSKGASHSVNHRSNIAKPMQISFFQLSQSSVLKCEI